MATAIIRATRQVRYVKKAEMSGSGIAAPPDDHIDVMGFRAMRLTLRVYLLEGTGPLLLGVLMETGMDSKDPMGFVSLGFFDLVGAKTDSVQRVFTDLQQYVRWRVFVLDGSDAVAQFTIEGILYE